MSKIQWNMHHLDNPIWASCSDIDKKHNTQLMVTFYYYYYYNSSFESFLLCKLICCFCHNVHNGPMANRNLNLDKKTLVHCRIFEKFCPLTSCRDPPSLDWAALLNLLLLLWTTYLCIRLCSDIQHGVNYWVIKIASLCVPQS